MRVASGILPAAFPALFFYRCTVFFGFTLGSDLKFYFRHSRRVIAHVMRVKKLNELIDGIKSREHNTIFFHKVFFLCPPYRVR